MSATPKVDIRPRTTESQNSSVSMSSTTGVSSMKALHILHSPDGYYTYLNIPIPPNTPLPAAATAQTSSSQVSAIDATVVQKNYRRLSLKHHPDRDGGDADTFRLLNRAKKVLTTDALRKQYDLLGLDLDDMEESDESGGANSDGAGAGSDEAGDSGSSSSPESIVGHMASATLASILQIVVRTVMVCCASTLISRFKLLILPLVGLLLFFVYRSQEANGGGGGGVTIATLKEFSVPGMLCMSIILMHIGRIYDSSRLFWLGESLTIGLFIYTSLPPEKVSTNTAYTILSFSGMVLALIVGGHFWRYAIVLGIEVILAIVAVLIFPIMEMILEEIINEKMRKVGEKIRALHKMKNLD